MMPAWTEQDFYHAYRASGLVQVDANTWRAVPIRGGYFRAARLPILRQTVPQWIEALGIQATDSVVLFGAAYGWSQEVAEEYFGQAVDWICVDTSAYIQNTKSQTERADIEARCDAAGLAVGNPKRDQVLVDCVDDLPRSRRTVINEDGKNQGSINSILNHLSKDKADFVITEELIQTTTDQEIGVAGTALNKLVDTGRIVHVTETTVGTLGPQDPNHQALRWMTTAEWRALLDSLGFPNHEVYSLGTGELL